jgi:putative addiction module component (TIGR02574 family)
MSIAEIRALPRIEKLKLMEALWADLAQDENALDSPEWHRAELEEAERRFAAGHEEIIDWEEAKKRLRRRSE